ncbi:MAG: hypothetical protein ACLVDM_05705, partial [Alistipes shahii]|uniref:hypothetical protein n=1 Tax=Alistipes shahii TaxID=328814 RepID=UPI00399CE6B1
EHMQKRESNICELDTCSFLRFSLPTNTEPQESAVFNSTEAVHGLPPPESSVVFDQRGIHRKNGTNG